MANNGDIFKPSFNLIKQLGLGLYHDVSTVISELISNSYDADSHNVLVKIPLDSWLAIETNGIVADRGFTIVVEDDGVGMTAEQLSEFYGVIGLNPRTDEKRGPLTSIDHRKRLGSWGIGRLSLFNICRTIEIYSAAGIETEKGYPITYARLNSDQIANDWQIPVHMIGYSTKRGTKIVLKDFFVRKTPKFDVFYKQMARLFDVESTDFKIAVFDENTGIQHIVGRLPVSFDNKSKISLDNRPVTLMDGERLPVTGWVALSSKAISDEELAGIMIYARGRLVSRTLDFGLSGYTGEILVRAYLFGVIHADWLDPDKGTSLVRMNRTDINWDTEIGRCFQIWGQRLLRELGQRAWASKTVLPLKSPKKTSSITTLEERIERRKNAIENLVQLLTKPKVLESELQQILEADPWMINPLWTVLQSNRSFENMRLAFEQWYSVNKKHVILTSTVGKQSRDKRPDFLMLHSGRSIEIVEIKRPNHALSSQEFDRIAGYLMSLNQFLNESPLIKAEFPKAHITLICDKIKLAPSQELAYNSLLEHVVLEKKTWLEVLTDCKKANDFIL